MKTTQFKSMLIALALSVMTGQAYAQLKGDINGDGIIAVDDITALIDYYLNPPSDVPQPYTSQGDIEIPAVVDGKIRLSAREQTYVSGTNDFGFNLFRAIDRQHEAEGKAGTSLVFSPLSITYALGLVNNGASPTVSKEITSMLGFGADGARAVNEFCANLIANAPLLDKEVTLNIANAFFLNSHWGFTLYDDFQADMSNYYKALVESLDFSDEASLRHVNAWGSEQTRGMIPNVLDQLNPYAVAYILNALYFKGAWTYPFNEEFTVPEFSFNKEDNTHRKVPMMNALIEGLPYAQDSNCTAVSLPYGNESYEMTLLLPGSGMTVGQMMASMTAVWTVSGL